MASTGRATVVGEERPGARDEHEGRTALRRLVAGVYDAWDLGDIDAVLAHFADDASLTDPFTARSVGRADIARHLERWRAWEPWSIHWVTNEQIVANAGGLVGTWLWSALSDVDGGARSVWSGGDLVVSAVPTEDGWRIAELAFGDRYRTPRDEGWLRTPFMVPIEAASTAGRARAAPAVTVVPIEPSPEGDDAARLARLEDETRVRAVMAEFVLDLEHRVVSKDVAQRWSPDGALHHVSASGVSSTASGTADVAALLAADAADVSAWMRVLTNEWIAVRGEVAHGRWRDLWTAERSGEPRWLAHAYEVDLVSTADAWRISRMRRTRLLDEPYGGER